MAGLFITFEGGEGAGKTTQIKLLADALKKIGHDPILTREPGGTPQAENIRNLLVHKDSGDFLPITECMLMCAARAEHVSHVIRPALDDGGIVICDRFADSTRAYQGYAQGLNRDVLETINSTATGGLEPIITFFLDMPPEIGLQRAKRVLTESGSTEGRNEGKAIAFHKKLYDGFIDLSQQYPDRIKRIDATRDIDTIHSQIYECVTAALIAHSKEV